MIDTHCHLNDPSAFPEPALAVQAALDAGVDQMLVVGVNPEDWRRAVDLAEAFEPLFAICGWHPNYSATYVRDRISELEDLLCHPKVVALGEFGLDFHWEYATRAQQEAALLDQLELAEKLSMPVVFHCREAYPELLTILEDRYGALRSLPKMLFHCFAGNREDAGRALALGCYFGVDGPITYKKSGSLREVLASIPTDRLVLETDSPYLTPVPFRGNPNSPANIPLINAALAEVLGVSAGVCAELTTANAVRFFDLASC